MKQFDETIFKKTIFIPVTMLVTGATFMAIPAYAQTPTVVATVTPGARGAAATAAIISRLKTRADAEITRRVTALTALISKISAMKRLTSDQQTSFTSGIQGQITSLSTLKTKIDADTDLPTLRTDVQSIVSAYRIFLVYMPQVNIMSNADRILALVDEMTQISTKLQTRLDSAKSSGNDTSAAQSLMSDRAAKLTDASTQAKNAINAVLPLTPTGYPGNRTTLLSARGMLQTARNDLKTAESDATQVRQMLHGYKNAPSPTPTP